MREFPFKAGPPVTGEFFSDREELLQELIESLKAIRSGTHQHFALISPRRMGKTSVMYELKQRLEKDGLICPYIDCMAFYPYDLYGFLTSYAEGIFKESSRHLGWKFAPERIKKALSGVPSALLDFVKEVGVEFKGLRVWVDFHEKKKPDINTLVDPTLALTEELGERFDCHFIVMLDEVQALREAFGQDFMKYLRSAIYHSKRADFIVAGSSVSVMQQMMESPSSPFYKLFITKTLGPLPAEDARKLLQERISLAGQSFTDEALNEILKLTLCHPFYLQYLGRACYIEALVRGRKTIDVDLVQDAYKKALSEETGYFEAELARVRGRKRDVLIAISVHNVHTPSQIADRLGLDHPGKLSFAFAELMAEGYLSKLREGYYDLTDQFFKAFLRQKFG
jgi:AAA+ ATPase superfamily predicted ATPase